MKKQTNKIEATAYITTLRMRFGNIDHKTDIDALSSQLEVMINKLSTSDYDTYFYSNGGHFPTLKRLINKYFKEFIYELRNNQNKIVMLMDKEYPAAIAQMKIFESEGWTHDKFIKFEDDFNNRVINSSAKGCKNKKWYQDGKLLIQNFNNIQKIIDSAKEYESNK